ncbi:MAG: hypothetical protein J5659_03600 [Clostridia bacterium]|nr:hypothetical protein [Clostridia bacterium]
MFICNGKGLLGKFLITAVCLLILLLPLSACTRTGNDNSSESLSNMSVGEDVDSSEASSVSSVKVKSNKTRKKLKKSGSDDSSVNTVTQDDDMGDSNDGSAQSRKLEYTYVDRYSDNSKNDLAFTQDVTYDNASEPTGNDKLHKYRYFNDLGSSRNLNGRVLVYCFFVDDSESSWTTEQSNEFLTKQINPALEFIKSEARRWNIEVSFDVESYCNETSSFSLEYNGTVNKDLSIGGSTKDILDKIAVNMGYASGNDFTSKDKNAKSYNDTVYLTLLNKKGVSYTRNLYVHGDDYYTDDNNSEHCVVFSHAYEDALPFLLSKERSATVAHEILHLFGAEDYYGEERLALAEQNYYYDIMTLSTRNIKLLKIMDMTAFCLGWTDDIPALCYNEIWMGARYR